MALFHPRIIEKHIQHVEQIPKIHADILSTWAENLSKGIYDSETQNDGEFIQRILIDVLGYVGSSEGQNWTVAKNQPVGTGNVDVALGNFSAKQTKIIAPFELKGAKTKNLDAVAGQNKTPVQQAWEYAMDAKGAQWVLVSNYREIRLYAVGYTRKNYETFDVSRLHEPDQYARFFLILSANSLLSGKTQGYLKESDQVDKDITVQLYADYKGLRAKLIKTIEEDNPKIKPLKIIRSTQTILDRILFVAFAEDKGLLPKNTLKQAYETENPYSPQPVWENFKGLFHAVNKGNSELEIPGYNGGLFADNPELDNLSISNELCEGFKKIGEYDFDSDVSVNILGHIFEQSISDLEELKAQAENVEQSSKKQSKRKKDGIFYTPAYITRYIVDKAIGGWLSDRKKELGFEKLPALTDEDYDSIKYIDRGKRKGQITYNKKIEKHVQIWEAYKEVFSNIKVLDPACGSGAFLNEVFDYLKNEGEVINGALANLKGTQTALFRWNTHILANNIYGVDLNSESVEITKLSLWLKTASKQEPLTHLDDNIKVGNSLIDDPNISGNFAFDWSEEFPGIMRNGGFDVVIGNPPWGAKFTKEHLENVKATNSDIVARMVNSYMFFVNHSLELTQCSGYNGWIVPDSILYQSDNRKLREKIIRHCSLENIINIGDAFDDVTQPCAILIFKKEEKKKYKISISDISTNINKEEAVNNLNYAFIQNSIIEKLPNFIWPTKELEGYPLLNKCKYNLIDFLDDDGIQRGVSPDFKDAFVLDVNLVEKNNLEKDFIRRTATGGNTIKRYFSYPTKKRLIYTDRTVNSSSIPNIFSHIMGFKEDITCKEIKQGKHPIYALHRARDEKIFTKQEKILGVITGDRIITTVDRDKTYPTDGLYLFGMKDGVNLDFTVAILNSKLITYLYRLLSGEIGRVLSQVKPTVLNNVPFPKVDELGQSFLIDKSLEIQSAKQALYEERNSFLKLLNSEFNLEIVRKALGNWFELEFSGFLKELEKAIKPKKLTLPQKSEWIQHFENKKSKALELKNKIDLIDHKIDQMVYELYKLTSEEIELIETNNN
jgi:hypothetical protein